MPRRLSSLRIGLCPGSAFGPYHWAEPEPRAQPIRNLELNGEAEPRLTSGGGAGADGVKFHDRVLIFKTIFSHRAAKPQDDV